MLPDAKWLEALKLPLKVMLAILFASGFLFAFDKFNLLNLEVFGAIARPIVLVIFVVSFIFSLVDVVYLLCTPHRERKKREALSARRAVRRREQEEQRAAEEERIISQLDHLSEEEISYIAECLRKGTPTFYTWAFSAAAGTLVGKGMAWTPGGTYNQDHYPFSIHDFVWTALLDRRDEFIHKHEEFKRAKEAAKRNPRRR